MCVQVSVPRAETAGGNNSVQGTSNVSYSAMYLIVLLPLLVLCSVLNIVTN